MKNSLLLLVPLLSLVACSSGGSGSSGAGADGITPQGSSSAAGRVAGYIAGGGASVAYAGYDSAGDYSLEIDVYSEAASCAANADNQGMANQTVLSMRFNISATSFGDMATPPRPGSYGIGIGYEVNAGFGANDKNCDRISISTLGDGLASNGQITLTSFDGTLAVGSYEVTFPTGDTLTGIFSAPVCTTSTSGSGSSSGGAPAPVCFSASQ